MHHVCIYVVPDGIDNPGGASPLRWHGDVSGGDRKAQWQGQMKYDQPKIHNVNWIYRNDTAGRCIEQGQSLTYTVAFSAPGFSAGMSTSFSKNGRDCIYTGNGTRHIHWEWPQLRLATMSRISLSAKSPYEACRCPV
jgi:hypothetical protein